MWWVWRTWTASHADTPIQTGRIAAQKHQRETERDEGTEVSISIHRQFNIYQPLIAIPSTASRKIHPGSHQRAQAKDLRPDKRAVVFHRKTDLFQVMTCANIGFLDVFLVAKEL